jgi:hypothetical protein
MDAIRICGNTIEPMPDTLRNVTRHLSQGLVGALGEQD